MRAPHLRLCLFIATDKTSIFDTLNRSFVNVSAVSTGETHEGLANLGIRKYSIHITFMSLILPVDTADVDKTPTVVVKIGGIVMGAVNKYQFH